MTEMMELVDKNLKTIIKNLILKDVKENRNIMNKEMGNLKKLLMGGGGVPWWYSG